MRLAAARPTSCRENTHLASAEILMSIVFNARPTRRCGTSIALVLVRLQRRFSTGPNQQEGDG